MEHSPFTAVSYYSYVSIPIMFLFKMADGNGTSSTADGKLGLQGWPLNTSGRTVDTQHNKWRLPFLTIMSPHISITVLQQPKLIFSSNRAHINDPSQATFLSISVYKQSPILAGQIYCTFSVWELLTIVIKLLFLINAQPNLSTYFELQHTQ